MAKSKEYQSAYRAKRKAAKNVNKNSSKEAYEAVRAEITGLPKLQGSEKQVAWANDIRERAFNYLNDVAYNTAHMGTDIRTKEELWNPMTDDRKATFDEINPVRKAMKRVFDSQTSARAIIDARDHLEYDDIKKIVSDIKTARANAREKGAEAQLTNDMIQIYFKRKTGL